MSTFDRLAKSPESSSFSQEGHVHRDPNHYFTNVTFQVEDTLFRVPCDHFKRESKVFCDMFQLPISEDTLSDGCSDEQPLRLDGVTNQDFRPLLKFMFPRTIPAEDLSLKEWTSVLKLTSMWVMDRLRGVVINRMSTLIEPEAQEWIATLSVSTQHRILEGRKLAIDRLSRRGAITSATKISLAREFNVEGWLKEGCQELVYREAVFSDEEEEAIGPKTACKLYRLRLQGVKHAFNSSYYNHSRVSAETIHKEFEAELKAIRNSGAMN